MPVDDETGFPELGDFSRVDSTDSAEFVARLDEMHALESFQSYKKGSFASLNLTHGSRVADVGCGTGDDAAKLANIVGPNGAVIGFDVSKSMVDQARSRYASIPNLSFTVADSENLNIHDACFDAVRADRVLIHVPSPQRTLAEMVRVLKPGGSIVISEPDMPGAWIASDNDEVSGLVINAISSSCKTPYLTRNLYSMFKEIGLIEVKLVINPVSTFSAIAVDKILDIRNVIKLLTIRGKVLPMVAQEWMQSLIELDRRGQFLAGLCILTLSGTKA